MILSEYPKKFRTLWARSYASSSSISLELLSMLFLMAEVSSLIVMTAKPITPRGRGT